jgi:thioesterase domain-containing protein
MRFITLLRARLGIDLSVTAVFLHPTPRELAARIDEIKGGAGAPASAGPVIKLNGGPGAAPLFLIHAIGGTVSSYLPLAGELAGTFEVHGLEAPGLSGPAPAAADLGDLVSDYIKLIRAQQPEGPYHLGGWSLGGVLAYEIAARLEQTGHQVGLVALLDAAFAMPGPAPSDEQLTGAFLTDVALSLGWDPADLPDPGRATASEQLDWLAARLGDGPAAAGDGPLQRRLAVFRAHTRLITGYQAGLPARPPVHAPAVVAGAGRSPNAPSLDQWPGLFTSARVTRIDDADHYTLLQLPHARRIAAAIERAHQDAPAGRPA